MAEVLSPLCAVTQKMVLFGCFEVIKTAVAQLTELFSFRIKVRISLGTSLTTHYGQTVTTKQGKGARYDLMCQCQITCRCKDVSLPIICKLL